MAPATNKHKQLILLQPTQAVLLDKLAAETRISKQNLLREAVEDLLGKYGMAESKFIDSIKEALQAGRAQAVQSHRVAIKQINGTGLVARNNSVAALELIDAAIEKFG